MWFRSRLRFGRDCVAVAIRKNRPNAEIALHVAAKMRFGEVKNLYDAAVSSWTGHILNPWVYLEKCTPSIA